MADPSPLRGLIIMPALNEAASVGPLVAELVDRLPRHDVLVVDDGSTDDTHAHVPVPGKVLRLPFNLGIGGAMQAGYRFAARYGYDFAVQVDADGQHPPAHVQQLIDHLVEHDADLVVASRFIEPGHYDQTPSRMAGMVILRTLIRMLTGRTFTDCTSGFRVVSKRVIAAYAHWYPEDYPEPEVLVLLQRHGFVIREVPSKMNPRVSGATSIPLMRGIFYVLKVSAAITLDMWRNPWPNNLLPNPREEAR